MRGPGEKVAIERVPRNSPNLRLAASRAWASPSLLCGCLVVGGGPGGRSRGRGVVPVRKEQSWPVGLCDRGQVTWTTGHTQWMYEPRALSAKQHSLGGWYFKYNYTLAPMGIAKEFHKFSPVSVEETSEMSGINYKYWSDICGVFGFKLEKKWKIQRNMWEKMPPRAKLWWRFLSDKLANPQREDPWKVREQSPAIDLPAPVRAGGGVMGRD